MLKQINLKNFLKIFLLLIVQTNVAFAYSGDEIALMIRKAAIKYEIPQGLLYAIAKIESNLNPYYQLSNYMRAVD